MMAVLLALGIMTGCGSSESDWSSVAEKSSAGTVSFTDDAGRSVEDTGI